MKKAGFTLIELLVSLAIFSMIIALSAYAFSFYARLVKKIVMPYPKLAEEFHSVNDLVKNTMYFIGEKPGIIHKASFFYYFYGDDRSMRFITLTKKGPILCKLYAKDEDLFLDEMPVYLKDSDYKNPFFISSETKRTMLINGGVRNFKILYYIGSTLKNNINTQIPTLIEVDFTKDRRNYVWYFKISSDFKEIKNYAIASFNSEE